MRKVPQNGLYQLFKSNDNSHWLVISQTGQINAAAATVYLSEKSKAPAWSIWINLGISGGSNKNYGLPFLINKVTNKSTNKSDYPSILFCKFLPRRELITVDYPENNYQESSLFDMEGASFFEIASRIASKDTTLLIKVVSDSPDNCISCLNSKIITTLIHKNIESITKSIEELEKISANESTFHEDPPGFEELNKKFHFTITQKHQLRQTLNKLKSLYGKSGPLTELSEEKSAKGVLRLLDSKMQQKKINWNNQ